MAAPTNLDAVTTPSRAVVVSDACSARAELQNDLRRLEDLYAGLTDEEKTGPLKTVNQVIVATLAMAIRLKAIAIKHSPQNSLLSRRRR